MGPQKNDAKAGMTRSADEPTRHAPHRSWQVQLKREMAGLSYAEQVARVAPPEAGLGRVVQRKPDETKYTAVQKGALSAELQAGLALAQANPTACPDPLPAWMLGNRPTDGQPYNTKQKKAFKEKWAWDYKNIDGKMPGVAGAGGYNEYYAQPASGASTPFGDNRVMRQTNDADGKIYWWATADHYTSFSWIKDA